MATIIERKREHYLSKLYSDETIQCHHPGVDADVYVYACIGRMAHMVARTSRQSAEAMKSRS